MSCDSSSSAGSCTARYAYWVKPLDDASNRPRWFGLSASRLSINFRLNGAADVISSGSLSEENVVPLSASAFPSLLTAIFLIEQPGRSARITSTPAQSSMWSGTLFLGLHSYRCMNSLHPGARLPDQCDESCSLRRSPTRTTIDLP